MNFFVSVNDYIVGVATFTVIVKINLVKYSYNTLELPNILWKISVGANFRIIDHNACKIIFTHLDQFIMCALLQFVRSSMPTARPCPVFFAIFFHINRVHVYENLHHSKFPVIQYGIFGEIFPLQNAPYLKFLHIHCSDMGT